MIRMLFESLFFISSLRYAGSGAALLASEPVGQTLPIDAQTVNIGSLRECALGQRYGDYRVGLQMHGIADGLGAALLGFRVREGILSRTIGNERALELLSDAWRKVLPAHASLTTAA